eukprot:TRINITY_DN15907_c0_g1_i1.p1 TRINITY_DN15907_c0_g1~~TRINITY_DN15907_c0_g1_i1.p1  ORF type:complete len:231 (-),score=8.79 TRINITY_DN15907_c0_g1_i1:309-1001(-)
MLDWINIKDRNINKQKIIRMQEDSKVEKASHRSADSQKTPAFGPENSQEETLYNYYSGGELSEVRARVPRSHHSDNSDPGSEETRAQLAYVATIKRPKELAKIQELDKNATDEEKFEILLANQKVLAANQETLKEILIESQKVLKEIIIASQKDFKEILTDKFDEFYRLLLNSQVRLGYLLNQMMAVPNVPGNSAQAGKIYCYTKSYRRQRDLWKSRTSRSERSYLQRQS